MRLTLPLFSKWNGFVVSLSLRGWRLLRTSCRTSAATARWRCTSLRCSFGSRSRAIFSSCSGVGCGLGAAAPGLLLVWVGRAFFLSCRAWSIFF